MKSTRKLPEYTDEPADGMELPDHAVRLTRAEQEALGIPAPEALAGAEWVRIVKKDRIVLQPRRGGARPGAGRKPKGNVRMQVLLPKRTREKIRQLARKRGVSMSAVITEAVERTS